ncbi:TPA: hypothetical protein ACGUVR_001813 [Vibrio vulnificus]|nr:hypothetical protein [Vibrio vulnificus]EJO9866293.1 hypothetical protein [Vibrio vulnificus]
MQNRHRDGREQHFSFGAIWRDIAHVGVANVGPLLLVVIRQRKARETETGIETMSPAVRQSSLTVSTTRYTTGHEIQKSSTKLTDSKTLEHSIYAEIEGLKGGAGFVACIDDGAITLLECFSHSSETWPSVLANFKFHAL